MSSNEPAIRVSNLGKCFEVYDKPRDRLKQFLLPRLRRLVGQPVRQYFKEFWALKDISFEIGKGETVGIIGRNGGGKSTLLQLICGTLSPTEGSVQTNGRVAALLELGSGFNPEFTGRENVYLYATVLGLSRDEIDARFDSIVEFADIGDFISQPVKTYSSGMYVRLAFAVIVHVDADILVIDEALAVGDVFFQQKCMRYLRGLQERGRTVLFVSHDASAVVSLCDRAVLLVRGQPPLIGKTEEICRKYIENVYAERDPAVLVTDQPAVPDRVLPTTRTVSVESEPPVENLIRITPFRADAQSFGKGGVSIVDTWFEDAAQTRLSMVGGGAPVTFCIKAHALQSISYPAFGLMLKDRLGQFVFTEGTDQGFRNRAPVFGAGDTMVVRFSFRMPILIQGEYSMNVAVAEGAGDDHVQHHWINDVLSLHSLKSRLVHGICGLQDLTMSMQVTSMDLE